ncbi:MAG: hypothetical protein WA147_14850 [Polaromonas sp.]
MADFNASCHPMAGQDAGAGWMVLHPVDQRMRTLGAACGMMIELRS